MSLPNIAASVLQINTTVNTLVSDISSITNTLAKIKHSIKILGLKIDQNNSQIAASGGVTSAVKTKAVPVKKLSFIECDEKLSNLISTLECILKTFPAIDKISYEQ